jgi:hypothetical protein
MINHANVSGLYKGLDCFARLSWLERDVTKRVLPDYRNIKSCSNIYVRTEIIEIGKQEHVELVKKLFNEELDIGIQHFIPLLKRGKQIGAGIYKDNHDEHGVHYHFCVGKNRTQHVRTKLMFTNGFKDNEDQSHDAIFYGEHGRYIDYRFFDLSNDIKEAIKKENNKLLSKFKNSDWLRPLKKFSKFEI